jgi:hypothetical protein
MNEKEEPTATHPLKQHRAAVMAARANEISIRFASPTMHDDTVFCLVSDGNGLSIEIPMWEFSHLVRKCTEGEGIGIPECKLWKVLQDRLKERIAPRRCPEDEGE